MTLMGDLLQFEQDRRKLADPKSAICGPIGIRDSLALDHVVAHRVFGTGEGHQAVLHRADHQHVLRQRFPVVAKRLVVGGYDAVVRALGLFQRLLDWGPLSLSTGKLSTACASRLRCARKATVPDRGSEARTTSWRPMYIERIRRPSPHPPVKRQAAYIVGGRGWQRGLRISPTRRRCAGLHRALEVKDSLPSSLDKVIDMNDTKRPTPAPPTSLGEHEARLVDRGDASGRNIEQNRAVGQGDPMEGSRAGRETMKESGVARTPGTGTDAAPPQGPKRASVAECARRAPRMVLEMDLEDGRPESGNKLVAMPPAL